MDKNMRIKKFNYFEGGKDIKNIYLESFDKNDRFSYFLLMFNLVLRRAEMYTLLLNEKVVAFMYVINDKKRKFILYLAVKDGYRNEGLGTSLLNWYLKNNEDSDIFLNIDEVDDKYDDIIVRKKRRDFYLKNGFYMTNYLSVSDDIRGDILSTKKEFDVDDYKLLDKRISKCFFCKCDDVQIKE